MIYYDLGYLESILQNLISNAIKYRFPDRVPEIHIVTAVIDNHVTLNVKDNGVGIDLKKNGSRLFGLRKTFHKHPEARGIGLFLVKMQVEAMGGEIMVESEIDKGTIFRIKLKSKK